MTTNFCPLPRRDRTGVEAALLAWESLLPDHMHTGQTSGPGGWGMRPELPLPVPVSSSFPLCVFAHTLPAGSEFTLFNSFRSLTQAPFLQNSPIHVPHTPLLIFACPRSKPSSPSAPGSFTTGSAFDVTFVHVFASRTTGHREGGAMVSPCTLSLHCAFRGLCTPREVLTSWISCLGGALSQG